MNNASSLKRCLLALLTLGLSTGESQAMSVEPGVSWEMAQYRASAISDLRYRLWLSIPADENDDIVGKIVIGFTLSDTGEPLQVDFREDPARLRGARVNGKAAEIQWTSEHLLIPAKLLQLGSNTLEFEFLAGNSSLNRNPDFLYTLFVPDRARTAFPVFDQPDLKASWELSLELPAAWAALSAAPLAREEISGERKTLQFVPSDRISSYLFSFVAGDFDTITREPGGRPMTLLHRESDTEIVARNVDEIFRLHASALAWLEDYTGIDYPYQKLDIALLPAHPYGGMEHAGAIQYRAERLWLDADASQSQLLNRASLIAHEVAHMWFGNLVTMRWFDDVWTKEVFANFMAAKIVNPSFPDIDHDLNFLVDHYPGAYSIDRTAGANPIRQPLENLDQAGQLYGPIIYDKAPIMMRQLELLLGEEAFREGMREYLQTYSHGNSSWPELVRILDGHSDAALEDWSEVWVNTAGRPAFSLHTTESLTLHQADPGGRRRLWPQQFSVMAMPGVSGFNSRLVVREADTALPPDAPLRAEDLLLDADGYGYGVFPVVPSAFSRWRDLPALPLAALMINGYEQMLETGTPAPREQLEHLLEIAVGVEEQLLIDLALDQGQRIYWTMVSDSHRKTLAPAVEQRLWDAMAASESEALRKIYFNGYADFALSAAALQRLAAVWSGDLELERLPVSERDRIRWTRLLAIKDPEHADRYVEDQLKRTGNPDQQRRLAYLAPSLSADPAVRDAFFASLTREENRSTESWVLDALEDLHHPLRTAHSRQYVQQSLTLLEEIQVTGDIFFPAGWLNRTLRNHNNEDVAAAVREFLRTRPDYNPQLRMKIQQAADPVFRSARLRSADQAE